MKTTTKVIHEAITGITCDLCKKSYSADTQSFDSFVSIQHNCGYGSFWQDGQTIEVDLCERCFKALTGDFCRVISQDTEAKDLLPINNQQISDWNTFFEPAERATDDETFERGAPITSKDFIHQAVEMMQGDISAAKDWLITPLEFFQGKSPLEVALEPEGSEKVCILIGRIRNGVFT